MESYENKINFAEANQRTLMPVIKCDTCENTQCFIKKYALPEWLPVISHYKPIFAINKNQTIFEEGEQANGIYFIYDGAAKVTKKWEGNREYIVRLAKKGDILGHRGFGSINTFPISATALTTTKLCYIEKEFFHKILKANNELLFHLMLFFADELQKAETRMRNLVQLPVIGRVADTLLLLEEAFGTNDSGFIDTFFSRKEIANLSGTTYESVVRTLAKLNNEDNIELQGKKVQIKNRKGLESLTQSG